MDLLHLKTLIYTPILENQNHYAEFYFGIHDEFMIDVTKFLFIGVYWLDALDMAIAATVDTLKLQVNIGKIVCRNMAVLPYVPVIGDKSRGPITLFYMHMANHTNLDDHYDVIAHDTKEYYTVA